MMKELFNRDNIFMTFLDRVADGLLLGLLWMIFSLPLFTIGGSTAAAYAVSLKLANGEDGYIIKTFVTSFKKNFKQGTLLWLIILLIVFILICDIDLYLNVIGEKGIILLLPVAMVGSLLFFIMIYAFPLLATFDNRIKDIIKNSLVIAIAYMPYTLLILGIIAGLFLIVYYLYLPFIILVPSLLFILTAYPINRVFKAIIVKKSSSIKN